MLHLIPLEAASACNMVWINGFDGAIIGTTLLAQSLKEIGIPSPGITQGGLIYAGYQIACGNWHIGLAIVAAAFLGSALGCSVAYGAGRFVGCKVINRWGRYCGLSADRLAKARDVAGVKAFLPVVVGRFMPALMAPLSFAAGTTRLPVLRFAAGVSLAMFLWAGFFIAIGALFGQSAAEFGLTDKGPVILAILGPIVIFSIVAVLLIKLRGRRFLPATKNTKIGSPTD